jgi:hypothetical protein
MSGLLTFYRVFLEELSIATMFLLIGNIMSPGSHRHRHRKLVPIADNACTPIIGNIGYGGSSIRHNRFFPSVMSVVNRRECTFGFCFSDAGIRLARKMWSPLTRRPSARARRMERPAGRFIRQAFHNRPRRFGASKPNDVWCSPLRSYSLAIFQTRMTLTNPPNLG